jgi:hypothetical protein
MDLQMAMEADMDDGLAVDIDGLSGETGNETSNVPSETSANGGPMEES